MSEADNKTSDKNVANEERLNNFIEAYKQTKEQSFIVDSINKDFFFEFVDCLLAEREQMTKRYEERDDELYERVKQCNNLQTEIDRLYLDKEELIELNRKQARQIQELEAKLEFKKFGDLDNVEFEEYMSQFIPKQVVIDVLQNNRNELFSMTYLSKEQYRPYEMQVERINKIEQELLEGEK